MPTPNNGNTPEPRELPDVSAQMADYDQRWADRERQANEIIRSAHLPGRGGIAPISVQRMLDSGDAAAMERVESGGNLTVADILRRSRGEMHPFADREIRAAYADRMVDRAARARARLSDRGTIRSSYGPSGGRRGRADLFKRPDGSFIRPGDADFEDAVIAFEEAEGRPYSPSLKKRHARLTDSQPTFKRPRSPLNSSQGALGAAIRAAPATPTSGTTGTSTGGEGATPGLTIRDTGPASARAILEAIEGGRAASREPVDEFIQSILGRSIMGPSDTPMQRTPGGPSSKASTIQ